MAKATTRAASLLTTVRDVVASVEIGKIGVHATHCRRDSPVFGHSVLLVLLRLLQAVTRELRAAVT